MTLGQVIPAERIAMYALALADLTEKQLAHGFDQALKLFVPQFGQTFPAPAQLREWAFQARQDAAIVDTRRILDRGDKPPDWEPLKPGEADQILREARERATQFRGKLLEAVNSGNGPRTTRSEEPS